jgi:hypothetical protein
MRYHKAVLITRPEAEYIIRNSTTSLNTCLVVESFDEWYDVRRMTETELDDFVASLHRDHLSGIAAGRITPH